MTNKKATPKPEVSQRGAIKRCISVPRRVWAEFEAEVAAMDAKKSTVLARLMQLFVAKRKEARAERP